MIVFVARYPKPETLRDGMMQRVAAIDNLVNDQKRVYLDISFKRNFVRKKEQFNNCIVENLNFFLHLHIIMSYLKKADKIYVHSIFNLLKIHFLYNPHKTILDLHGIAPEEMILMGKKSMSLALNIVEKKAIYHCRRLIHVTHAMLEHFENKYECKLKERSIILPIFELDEVEIEHSKWNDEVIRVAYAGGMQNWQNIDLMVDSIKKINNSKNKSNIEFHLFFPQDQVTIFKEKYLEICKSINVTVSSLPKEEILNFLSSCHFGFILRDDILVNRVACPTKLIEYLECGVIPIVKQPKIGDFDSLGYGYTTVDDLTEHMIKTETLVKTINKNHEILRIFSEQAMLSRLTVSELLKKPNW